MPACVTADRCIVQCKSHKDLGVSHAGLTAIVSERGGQELWRTLAVAQSLTANDQDTDTSFLLCPRKMHSVTAFANMTCFKMLHSEVGREVWLHKGKRTSAKEKACSVNCSHPVVQELRVLHGLHAQQKRRRRTGHGLDEGDCQADTEESQSQTLRTEQFSLTVKQMSHQPICQFPTKPARGSPSSQK